MRAPRGKDDGGGMTDDHDTLAEPVDPTGAQDSPHSAPRDGATDGDTGAPSGAGTGTGTGSNGSRDVPPNYPPPTYYPPQRPPLRRSRTDRVISGVCGGFAATLGIDAALLRILLVVGTVFTGGALLLVYGVAWLVMQDEDAPTYRAPSYAPAYAPPAYATAGAPSPAAPPPSFAAGGTGTYVDPGTGAVYGAPAPPPRPVRTEPRSYLGLLTASVAVVAVGGLALLGAFGVSVSGLVVSAVLLLVLGVGLLVGAWRGRARWLIAPAIVVLVIVQGIAAAHGLIGSTTGAGVGDRVWVPTSDSSDYSLGAGEAKLDLSRLPDGDVDVTVSQGVGHLVVYVPADTTVNLDATVGAGEVDVVGRPATSGTGLDVSSTLEATAVGGARTTVDLTTDLGLGQLEVRRAAS